MTQSEIKNSIIGAMDEPKAPDEVIEKGLTIARAFMKAQEMNHKPPEKEEPKREIGGGLPSIGGMGM